MSKVVLSIMILVLLPLLSSCQEAINQSKKVGGNVPQGGKIEVNDQCLPEYFDHPIL